MQKFLSYALFLLLVSGLLFAGCEGEEEGEEAEGEGRVEEKQKEGNGTGDEPNEVEIELDAEGDVEIRTVPSESSDSESEATTSTTNGSSATESSSGNSAKSETVIVEEASEYLDGTYSATGSYTSPAGAETVGVTLTIENDAVTAVSIRNDGANDKTKNYQSLFASGITSLIVGQSLDSIGGYDSVNGSSLTPDGFDSALATIKTQAAS